MTTETTNSQQLTKEQPSFSLEPKSFEEAIKYAEYMASSDMVPKQYKDRPANVLIAVQMGRDLGFSATKAIQNIAVINGRPSIYGDIGKALLLEKGCDIDEDDMLVVAENERARCRITRPGKKPVERTFSVEDAKKAGLWEYNDVWKKYPYRQLMWRAFWFAARDAAADILSGLSGVEEVKDMGDAVVIDNDTDGESLEDQLKKAKPTKRKVSKAKPKKKAKEEDIVDAEIIEQEDFVKEVNATEKQKEHEQKEKKPASSKSTYDPIEPQRLKIVNARLNASGKSKKLLLEEFGVETMGKLPNDKVNEILDWIQK